MRKLGAMFAFALLVTLSRSQAQDAVEELKTATYTVKDIKYLARIYPEDIDPVIVPPEIFDAFKIKAGKRYKITHNTIVVTKLEEAPDTPKSLSTLVKDVKYLARLYVEDSDPIIVTPEVTDTLKLVKGKKYQVTHTRILVKKIEKVD